MSLAVITVMSYCVGRADSLEWSMHVNQERDDDDLSFNNTRGRQP
jgi:hypothetical protein